MSDLAQTLLALDRSVAVWIYHLPLHIPTMLAITLLCAKGGIWTASGTAMLFVKRWRRCGLALVCGLLTHLALIDHGLKPLVGRLRPLHSLPFDDRGGSLNPMSPSFPSGHSLASFMCAYILATRFPKLRIPLFLTAALIAFSRVFLGVHYFSDILVGAVLGITFGFFIAKAFKLQPARDGYASQPGSTTSQTSFADV